MHTGGDSPFSKYSGFRGECSTHVNNRLIPAIVQVKSVWFIKSVFNLVALLAHSIPEILT